MHGLDVIKLRQDLAVYHEYRDARIDGNTELAERIRAANPDIFGNPSADRTIFDHRTVADALREAADYGRKVGRDMTEKAATAYYYLIGRLGISGRREFDAASPDV